MHLQSASRPRASIAPARVAAWRVKPSRLAQSGLSYCSAVATRGESGIFLRRHSGPAGGDRPDAADAVLEHVAHLARRQARQLREGHAVGAQLAIAAVQEEHMQMWMELQVGARRIATASRITSVDRTARASSSIRTADGMNRLEAVRPRCSWEKRLSSRR